MVLTSQAHKASLFQRVNFAVVLVDVAIPFSWAIALGEKVFGGGGDVIIRVVFRKPLDKFVFLVEFRASQPILYLRIDGFIINVLSTDFRYGLSIVMELGDYGLLNCALNNV